VIKTVEFGIVEAIVNVRCDTMAKWIDAIAASNLSKGEHTVIETAIGAVALFNLGNEMVAIEDRCSHDGGELACGKIEGDEIICPRHGAHFSLRSGEALTPPAYEAIDVFPVRNHNGMLQIDVDD